MEEEQRMATHPKWYMLTCRKPGGGVEEWVGEHYLQDHTSAHAHSHPHPGPRCSTHAPRAGKLR